MTGTVRIRRTSKSGRLPEVYKIIKQSTLRRATIKYIKDIKLKANLNDYIKLAEHAYTSQNKKCFVCGEPLRNIAVVACDGIPRLVEKVFYYPSDFNKFPTIKKYSIHDVKFGDINSIPMMKSEHFRVPNITQLHMLVLEEIISIVYEKLSNMPVNIYFDYGVASESVTAVLETYMNPSILNRYKGEKPRITIYDDFNITVKLWEPNYNASYNYTLLGNRSTFASFDAKHPSFDVVRVAEAAIMLLRTIWSTL